MEKIRLDALLHERGLYPSRSAASAAVLAGDVQIEGYRSSDGPVKPGRMVKTDIVVEIAKPPKYVSRGGTKLENALSRVQIDLVGRNALDVGSSTGGFTDCMLQSGVRRVTCVDVGYGELAWSIRQDERVTVIERQNARYLEPEMLPYAPDLVTADVSFISLRKIIPALSTVVAPKFDALLMVKPQFEVGRERVGSGGVVRDPETRRDAVLQVARCAAEHGWSTVAAASSDLPGPKGNRETFLQLAEAGRSGAANIDDLLAEVDV